MSATERKYTNSKALRYGSILRIYRTMEHLLRAGVLSEDGKLVATGIIAGLGTAMKNDEDTGFVRHFIQIATEAEALHAKEFLEVLNDPRMIEKLAKLIGVHFPDMDEEDENGE